MRLRAFAKHRFFFGAREASPSRATLDSRTLSCRLVLVLNGIAQQCFVGLQSDSLERGCGDDAVEQH